MECQIPRPERGTPAKASEACEGDTCESVGGDACDAGSGDGEDRQLDTVEKCHVSDFGHIGRDRYIADRVAIIKTLVGNRGEHGRKRNRTQFLTAGKTTRTKCCQLVAERDTVQLFTARKAFRAHCRYILAAAEG